MALVPKYIRNLSPYIPGMTINEVKRKFALTNIIKLASNENPLGPSPKAIEYVIENNQLGIWVESDQGINVTINVSNICIQEFDEYCPDDN